MKYKTSFKPRIIWQTVKVALATKDCARPRGKDDISCSDKKVEEIAYICVIKWDLKTQKGPRIITAPQNVLVRKILTFTWWRELVKLSERVYKLITFRGKNEHYQTRFFFRRSTQEVNKGLQKAGLVLA